MKILRRISALAPGLLVLGMLLACFSGNPVPAAEKEASKTSSVSESGEVKDPFAGQNWSGRVVVIPVKGAILPDFLGGQETALVKAFEKVKADKPKLVVVEVDSPGGAVSSCDAINHVMLKCGVPTVALVLHKAISGGALLATACNEIAMVRGSRIGDVQPMAMMPGQEGMDDRTAEKIEADIRAMFSANADANGYPVGVLHAMVSRSIELYRVTFSDDTVEYLKTPEFRVLEENIAAGRDKRKIKDKELVVEEGKLLHVSADQAAHLGLAKEVVDSAETFYKNRAIAPADRVNVEIAAGEFNWSIPTWKIVVLGLFLVVGIAGTLTEMHTPGFGLPGAIGIIGFACFFTVLSLHGTASSWEIGLFVVGIILLVIEIVVLPGFGVAGVLGVLCVLAGLALSFLPDLNSPYMVEHKWDVLAKFVLLLFLSGFVASLAAYFAITYGRKLAFLHVFYHGDSLPTGRDALADAKQHEGEEHTARLNPHAALLGKCGVAETYLRPAGKMRLDDGGLLDVVSDGRLLAQGTRIVVSDVGMNRILVVPEGNQTPQA